MRSRKRSRRSSKRGGDRERESHPSRPIVLASQIDTGSDPVTGRRITKFVTLRGTRRQAQAEANKILAGVAGGTHVDPSTETVATFVERWLKDWADDNISNKTWTRYSQLLRRHLCSRFGTLPVQKLTAAHLQRAYAEMAKAGLADRTRLHLHRVTHTMLKHAMQWGVVSRNVASMVDAPRVKAREVEILTPAQIQAVLDTLRGKSLYPIVATALGTGLRRSELLALRWQDVDLDSAMLRVERALEQTKRGGLVFRQPKTRHGKRSVSLPPSTVTVLREHRVTQLEQRLTLGLGKAPANALVFATWDGSTRSPNALTKEWSLAMQRAGLTATLHSLRHTHASTLIASGLDVLTISRRLGHGSPAITLGVYGHLFKPDDRAAAIMEAAFTAAHMD
jgi:integrase